MGHSLGPLPMSLVVVLLAALIAGVVGWRLGRGQSATPAGKVPETILDMLLVGLLAARLGFVLEWLPQYLADPWSIVRIGDGGFSAWPGAFAGLAFGAWRLRKQQALRRPLALGVLAGLMAWVSLAGALALLLQSAVKLPSSALSTLDGASTRLSVMSGRPMALNLWATWCPPCRREMPMLAKAQAEHAEVTFAFVNQGESAQQVRAYLGDAGLQLDNVLLDPFSSVSREVGSRGLPTTLFFDANGRLVDTHVGELSEASLTQKLRHLAGGAPPDRNRFPLPGR